MTVMTGGLAAYYLGSGISSSCMLLSSEGFDARIYAWPGCATCTGVSNNYGLPFVFIIIHYIGTHCTQQGLRDTVTSSSYN